MTQSSASRAALSSLILALLITTTVSFFIIKSIAKIPLPDNFLMVALLSLSIGTNITTGFYTGLHRGLFLKKVSPLQDPSSLVSYIALVQTMAMLLYAMGKIPEPGLYLGSVALQSWLSWLVLSIARPGLNAKHPAISRLPWAAAISTGLFGLLAWPLRNFWPLETLLAATAIWQATTNVTIITGTWLWFALTPKYRLGGQHTLAAMKLRLQRQDKRFSPWVSSFVATCFQVAVLASFILLSPKDTPVSWQILLMAIHFHVFPCLLDAWSNFSQAGTDNENYVTLSRLAAQSAKKLIKRQASSHTTWATAVGLKTATFTLDHDPESNVAKDLPATLMRIRNDEIFNILTKITQNQTISLTSVSQKIIGTIDPEQSNRPCVDALNLCATLHLDADPIIERRISGLVALLPIVNPGLATLVNPSQITSLLKRSHWFFHFDFSWVDQSLINTPAATRYGIQMDPVSSDTQWALLTEMRKTHSIGNFLWIGREAYERLLQEAPHIAPIIQPHILKSSKNEETLFFIIKFEQLIPRLQRYYGLDDVRARIIDYEPSPEAQRLLSLLTMQMHAAKTLLDKRRIVESLTSYQWHGFKEKDQALRILLKIHQQETDHTKSASTPDRVFKESFTELLRTSIGQIGYPSQILNQAHIHKIELRNIPKLRVHALDPNSLRFEEAWVVMSNLNHQKSDAEDAKLVREIVNSAMKDPQVMQVVFVHGKMIDAAVALGRRDDSSDKDLALLHRLLDMIIDCGTTDECLALAMDGIVLVTEKLKQPVLFSRKATLYFESRLTHPASTNQKSCPAITSRWQEHRSQSTSQQSNKIKAS